MRRFLGALGLVAMIGVSGAMAQKADPEKIKALRKDIADLKAKLAEKEAELEKLEPKLERILDAADAPKEAPLRPLKEFATYKLSNPRIEVPEPGKGPVLKLHYELVVPGKNPDPLPVLAARLADGRQAYVGTYGYLSGKAGDITFTHNLNRIGGEKAKDVEFFLVFTDNRWEDEGFKPTFKYSNSAVMGNLDRPLMNAREWTPEETQKLNDPPPLCPVSGANLNVGKDTKWIGVVEGMPIPTARYADPKKRPVIGFYYNLGTFEPEKGKKAGCIADIVPSYDMRQRSGGLKKEMAKDGYAIGAVNLKTNPYVTAFQVVYMKIKPGGGLDTKDSYTSDWIGEPGPDDKEATLTGNGRKIIGTHGRGGFGKVYALALVSE